MSKLTKISIAIDVVLLGFLGVVVITKGDPLNLWQDSGSNIYYTAGNVGIGTTGPAGILDVSGSLARFYNQSGTNQTLLQVRNGSSQGGNNAFQIVANDGSTNIFSVQGTGGVTATADIHLTDGTNDRFTAMSNLANAGAPGSEDGGGFLFGKGGTFSGIGAGGGGYLNNERIINFFTGNDFTTEKMIIRANGNVGIGTTTPSSKLTVQGDINFTGNLYENGILFSGEGSGLSTPASTTWGSITGTLSNQTDLQAILTNLQNQINSIATSTAAQLATNQYQTNIFYGFLLFAISTGFIIMTFKLK